MPKMCALVGPGMSPVPIYVNPLTVRYVRPVAGGVSATIHFADDQSISVSMPVDQVIHALDIAMNADHV